LSDARLSIINKEGAGKRQKEFYCAESERSESHLPALKREDEEAGSRPNIQSGRSGRGGKRKWMHT